MRFRFNIAFLLLLAIVCSALFQSSLAHDAHDSNDNEDRARAANWSPDSHSKKTDPNYSIVFPSNQVNTLTITIAPANWQAMQDNMAQLYGTTTNSTLSTQATVNTSTTSGQAVAEITVPITADSITAKPIWVKADISFNGRLWQNVGIRYKGNSTLSRSWLAGTKKMPFKFDFDEFEDDYPEIKNQRFYGFKQLLLNNNISDPSYLRDAASYTVMRDMGLVAPKTAWYNVYLDYGQGPEQLGIYTMIEVIDDTVIKAFYGSDKGNLYEANGIGASLSRDNVAELMESFDKENNKDSDYSDLAKLFQVLHANYRSSEVERWHAELEAIFNVDDFLKWLASNTVIQNWDTYGAMAHNFYLYNVPDTGQFSWIGWDYNESMGARAYGSTLSTTQTTELVNTTTTMQTKGLAAITSSVDHSAITDDWPLIRFLLDDPVYSESYKAYVEEVISTAYAPETMSEAYTLWSNMLRPYAEDVMGFEAEVERLRGHGEARAVDVYEFLGYENVP